MRAKQKVIASPGKTAKSATRSRTRLNKLGMSSGAKLNANVSNPAAMRLRRAATIDQLLGLRIGILFIYHLVHALNKHHAQC